MTTTSISKHQDKKTKGDHMVNDVPQLNLDMRSRLEPNQFRFMILCLEYSFQEAIFTLTQEQEQGGS